MENLIQDDTEFFLWCLGYILGQADKMDEAHKKFIEKGHASVFPKIAELHESFNKDRAKMKQNELTDRNYSCRSQS